MRGTKPHLATAAKGMAAMPRPPAMLSKDAKAEWRRVVPELVERRILTNADLGALENYAIAMGIVRQAQRELAAFGSLTFSGPSGLKRHPAVGVMNEAMGVALRHQAELGLTPVSRSRPAIRDDGDDGEDDALGL